MRRSAMACFWLAGLVITIALEMPVIAAKPQGQQPESATSQASPFAKVSSSRALLNQYCVTCHNERLKTAGLTLDRADVEHVGLSVEVWEKVAHKVRSGAMPPPGLPRPDKSTLGAFVVHLETELDREAAAHPDPGRPPEHRLNQFEYSNAVRDLLALDIDAGSLLPADESDHGFDNIADVLTVSPTLMDRYLAVAGKLSRLVGADVTSWSYDLARPRAQDVVVLDVVAASSEHRRQRLHRLPEQGRAHIIDRYLRLSPEPAHCESLSASTRIRTEISCRAWSGTEAPDWLSGERDRLQSSNQM